MSTAKQRARTLSLLAAPLLVGCIDPSVAEDPPVSCDRCDGFADEAPLEAVPGPQVLRCALEPAEGGELLACVHEPPAEGYPLVVREVTVAAIETPADPGSVTSALGSATFTAPGRREVLTVAAAEYPLLVQVSVRLGSEAEGLLRTNRGDDLSSLSTSWSVSGPEAGPWTFAIPFDLWPLDVEVPEGVRLWATIDPYELPLAPWVNAASLDGPTRTASLPRIGPEATTVATWLAAPSGTERLAGVAEIAVGARWMEPSAFVLDGPGRYLADAEGLRRVDPPSSTTGAAEPDDGCGGEGQPQCYVDGHYVCDEGFVYASWDRVCYECGGEGQPQCYVDGRYVCDEGFV